MPNPNASRPAMDLNPYAAPNLVDDASVAQVNPFVDGYCIVVGSGANLPQRCIFTNEAVSPSDRRRRRLDWAPPFRLVLRHRRCHLTYCVSCWHRRKQFRNRILLGSVLSGLTWMTLGNAFLWVLPIIGIIIAAVPMDAVRVVAYRDGRFWITGFSDAFLRSCAQEYGITPPLNAKPPH